MFTKAKEMLIGDATIRYMDRRSQIHFPQKEKKSADWQHSSKTHGNELTNSPYQKAKKSADWQHSCKTHGNEHTNSP
jgi:hypothetical protein